jgi:hypothetical protein
MTQFVIETVNINDVIRYDKERYNSNNHWISPETGLEVIPADYREKNSQSETKHWVDKFRTNYKKIIIDDPYELGWMKQAARASAETGKFTRLFEEELDDFVKKYEAKHRDIFNGTGYFVRTESVSLKYGQHGKGPYTSLRKIIESVVSCIHGHTPIYENTKEIVLYLFDWVDIEAGNEYRVFVNKGRITAVSQQSLYKVFDRKDEEALHQSLQLIVDYFNSDMKARITHCDSYVYDFAILKGTIPYFIEINPFGKEYGSGSSLFHWLLDEDKLYGTAQENCVFFRYTIREELVV